MRGQFQQRHQIFAQQSSAPSPSNSGAGLQYPFQHFKTQLEWDKQVHNAFLLELNWEYASNWQVLKDRLKVILAIDNGGYFDGSSDYMYRHKTR